MRRLGEESGTAMVELALFLPVYILILVGIADYGFLIEEKIQVQEAASAGAAYATVPGNYKDTNGMKTAAQASSSMLGTATSVAAADVYSCSVAGGAVSAGATCSGGGGPLMFAQVTTTYTANTVLHYVGFASSVSMQGFASYEVPWTP